MPAGRGPGRTGTHGGTGLGPGGGLSRDRATSGGHGELGACPFSFVTAALLEGAAGALAHGREGSILARGAAGTPLGSLTLASSSSSRNSFSPPPRRRRPATRSPWALRSSEVLRQPRGRGVRTSPWAPCTFFPLSSLPLSWQAAAEAVDPGGPQQIRARRCSSARPAPASHWAPRARGARTWPSAKTQCGGAAKFDLFEFERKSCGSPRLTFSLTGRNSELLFWVETKLPLQPDRGAQDCGDVSTRTEDLPPPS
nr:uncharacterized protein LOC105880811 [Microcebus murinus]